MPRGQKSKLRPRKKFHQAQGEPQNRPNAQATAAKEKRFCSSSPLLGVITRTKSAFRSQRDLKKPQKALSTTVSGSVSPTRSCEGANSKIKKKRCSSQAPRSSVRSCKDSLTKTTRLLTQFIMHMFRMKKPIMKEDMLKVINKKYENRFLEILRRASFSIEVVFGADLKEVDSTKQSYDLVSKMNLPNQGRVSPGRGFPKTGLLMNLLGVIFMKGNCAAEEKIWEFLNKMQIYDGKKHFIFGEPRKLITQDLVKLKYLEYRQVPDSDPACYEFLWGPRAHAETSKMKILQFWARINRTVPSTFHSWYEEALRDEKERAQAAVLLNNTLMPLPSNVPGQCPAAPPTPNDVEAEGSQCSK